MPDITFIQVDSSERVIAASVGESLMMTALNHDVRGIDGECGGGLACGTCHVYVGEEWLSQLPEPDADELDMLGLVGNARRTSRLGCQILVGPQLEGMRVTVATS
jgi:ferredoxin, 2Fe-2S